MGETKREYLTLYSYYDRTGIAAHLAQMAEQGWLLDKMSPWYWRYRKIQPRKLTFAVTYFPKATPYTPTPAAGQETFWDLCAEAGWVLAAESAQVQVFYNEQEDAVPIETDPEVEFENIHRTMKKSTVGTYGALFALSLFELGFQLWRLRDDPIGILSSTVNLSAAVSFLPLLLLTAVELIRYFLWHRKAKEAVEAGLPVPDLRTSKKLSVLIILLSALEVVGMLMGSLQTSRVMLISLVFMLVFMILIIVLSNGARTAMRHLGVKAWINKAVSVGMVAVLFVAMMSGMTALIFKSDDIPFLRDPSITERYEYRGMTWSAYGDTLPLTIQDLVETDYDRWSTRLTRESSPLLTHLEGTQRPRMDALEQPDLEYELVIVKAAPLYDLCKQQFVDWLERHNEDVPQEYRDEYRPIDAAPWGAAEAYQRYGSGTPSNQFLICWEDRIAEIHFDYEWAITEAMMQTTTEKLCAAN